MNTIEQTEIEKLKKSILEHEKMAALGLLNAGIMHEIQNPLSFVLNFSNISAELVEELMDWRKNNGSKLDEEETKDFDDVVYLLDQNIKKIGEHGKRIELIAKGILGYSRNTKQEKSQVRLNEMVAQYTRFSYYAMRANAKGFSVNIVEDFNEDMNDVMAYPGELSRALLNITNNAFYAVWEKSRQLGAEYAPTVTITTARDKEYIQIKIEDNGNGIPEEVKTSMFNPFFTTKPESEGTGLGLYITKRIVEERHGGSLQVESESGKFTRFTITIPPK